MKFILENAMTPEELKLDGHQELREKIQKERLLRELAEKIEYGEEYLLKITKRTNREIDPHGSLIVMTRMIAEIEEV